MAIIIRIAAVLGAIWSVVVSGIMTMVGSLVSFLGLFDRAHTSEFISVTIGLEILLLWALWEAGKLRLRAAPVMLFWLVAFSALINAPFVLSEWPKLFWGVLVYFLPVTLTMLFLTLHGAIAHVKARRGSRQIALQQKALVVPPLP